ncbi:hypothetical protein Tdes44962_MAKER06710, partial [Teratosphaeria destructans]
SISPTQARQWSFKSLLTACHALSTWFLDAAPAAISSRASSRESMDQLLVTSSSNRRRKIDIESVFDSPQEPSRTSISPSERVVEGNLHVRRLRDVISGYGIWKGDLDAGSLPVIVTLTLDARESCHEKYASKTVGTWANGGADELENDGIALEYELEHKVTNEIVSTTRQTKHGRHFEQTRFGKQPWTKLVFHYRFQAASSELVTGLTHAFEPLIDPQSFMRGSMATKKALNQKSRKVRDGSRTVAETASRESSAGIFVSPNPPGPPLAKRKLFGTPLQTGFEEYNREPYSIEAGIRSKYEDSFRTMSEQGSSVAKAAGEDVAEVFGGAPGNALEDQAPAATMTTMPPPFVSGGGGIGSEGHEDTFSRASSVIVNEHDITSVPAEAEARVRQEEGLHSNPDAKRENGTHNNLRVTNNSSTEGEYAAQQSETTTGTITEERAQNEPGKMSEIRTWFPSPSKSPEVMSITVKGRTITADEVGWHIKTSGSTLLELASALMMREEFEHNRHLARQFVKLVQNVGYRKATEPNTYHLKPRTTSPQPAAPPSQEQQASPEGIAQENNSSASSQGGGSSATAGDLAEQVKMQEAQAQASTSAAPAPRSGTCDVTNTAVNTATPQPATGKRPASAMTLAGDDDDDNNNNNSRESTPLGKRQRRGEQAARKAAAMKQRDELRAKKAAAEAARDLKAKEKERELALKAERAAAEAERDRLAEEEIARLLAEGEGLAEEVEEVEKEGLALSLEVEELVEERVEDEELTE